MRVSSRYCRQYVARGRDCARRAFGDVRAGEAYFYQTGVGRKGKACQIFKRVFQLWVYGFALFAVVVYGSEHAGGADHLLRRRSCGVQYFELDVRGIYRNGRQKRNFSEKGVAQSRDHLGHRQLGAVFCDAETADRVYGSRYRGI